MIRIRNVYYMLAYAFRVLQEQGYRNLAAEEFENTAELCAAILIQGIRRQIKRGLGKEYIPQTEMLSSLRGEDSSVGIHPDAGISAQADDLFL